jgi:hypothetical protein
MALQVAKSVLSRELVQMPTVAQCQSPVERVRLVALVQSAFNRQKVQQRAVVPLIWQVGPVRREKVELYNYLLAMQAKLQDQSPFAQASAKVAQVAMLC